MLSITGATLPLASSGQTFSSSARASSAFTSGRARPQRRAGQRDPLDHQPHQVDRGLRALQEGDLVDAAILGDAVQIALDIVAADHVEDQIDALAAGFLLDHGDEILPRGS